MLTKSSRGKPRLRMFQSRLGNVSKRNWLNVGWAYLSFWWFIYREKIKPYMRPSIGISFLIAWMITNGWAYLFIAIGTDAMRIVGATYAAILWLPFTPEKLVTVPLAILIQKILFTRRIV